MNNEMNGADYRITLNESGKFTPLVKGDHSQTQREFETMQKLKIYISEKKYNGEKLVQKNDGSWKYYLVEDGNIFKMNDDYYCYRLDLSNFTWIHDQRIISIINDGFLKCKELVNFDDYYENQDLDLSKGRHL